MPIPPAPIRPGRTLFGASAVLLPFAADGSVDWPGFERLLDRTVAAGLTPAVNMDTGYANLITDEERNEVLTRCRERSIRFIGGAFVGDSPGNSFNLAAYERAAAEVVEHGGTPILFQSYGLTSLQNEALADAYNRVGEAIGDFYAFELGTMFAPFGRIYSFEEYGLLLANPRCLGAKHSSLSRQLEWDRLQLRDAERPDFRVLTGNDLAIDMVQYGSDYLLGLSAFHPEAFAVRDRLWAEGDAAFYELNDLLQYLGFLAFRSPVPAYKHNAAMMLHARGLIATDATHPESPSRPASDADILAEILERLDQWIAGDF